MIGYPGDPLGGTPQEIWARKLLAFITRYLVLEIKGAKRTPQANGGVTYEILPQKSAGGGGGDSWPPIELDPSASCSVGDWRYVAPTDAIATTGLKDLTLGTVIQAAPGLWRARLAVPAATGAGYNVPQDLGISGYWVLIQGYGYC